MLNADDVRRILRLVTAAAVAEAARIVSSDDDPRPLLVEGVPFVVAYYADGSAALAADYYDDVRDVANPKRRYVAEPVVDLRLERLRRAILWAAEPIYRPEPDRLAARTRLAEVVDLAVARPFRETITENQKRDPAAVGWRRYAHGDTCKFCRMLAGRGAVYKESTARFASHPHCDCTAAPVFDDGDGPEANVLQYVASKRRKSTAEREALRRYLATLPD